MKAKTKFLALAVAVIFTGAAHGQTANSTSGAGASTTTTANPVNTNVGNGASTSASGSQAGAVSSTTGNSVGMGVTVEQDFSTPGKQYIEYGGSHSVNTNVSGTTTLRNVPNVVPPNILPTSPCMGSSSLGGSVAGFGIGGGTSWKDTDCGYRETARVFMQAGRMEDGIAVLCASEYAGTAPVCKNLAAQQKRSEAGQVQAQAKETMIRDQNDRGRTTATTLGQMSKSQQDYALTKAAMLPERDRKAENCRLAGEDVMMRARFECGIHHPVAFKQ